MSSSSSLAAARRRRAGPGPNAPKISPNSATSAQSVKAQLPQPLPKDNSATSPFILLQQHHQKLNIIEQTLSELAQKEYSQPSSSSEGLDFESIEKQITENIENKFEMKSLFENDENLLAEIETLQSVVNNQQILINQMNVTILHLVSCLKIDLPEGDNTQEPISFSKNPFSDSENIEQNDKLPTFPKAITEENSIIKEDMETNATISENENTEVNNSEEN